MAADAIENLRHGPVASILAHQALAQSLQALRHVGKGRAVSQCPGLALHQRHVVLLVIANMAPVGQPFVPGHDQLVTGHLHPATVQPAGTHALAR